jgi:hypothetical protein
MNEQYERDQADMAQLAEVLQPQHSLVQLYREKLNRVLDNLRQYFMEHPNLPISAFTDRTDRVLLELLQEMTTARTALDAAKAFELLETTDGNQPN